jgi:hypothetical protein
MLIFNKKKTAIDAAATDNSGGIYQVYSPHVFQVSPNIDAKKSS